MKRKESVRGHNYVFLGGFVEGGIISGTTNDGGSAFSFNLVFSDSGDRLTRIRVNAYASVASVCDRSAEEGVFCVVVGEIMNRLGKYSKLTEVRAKEIEFFPEVSNRLGEDR